MPLAFFKKNSLFIIFESVLLYCWTTITSKHLHYYKFIGDSLRPSYKVNRAEIETNSKTIGDLLHCPPCRAPLNSIVNLLQGCLGEEEFRFRLMLSERSNRIVWRLSKISFFMGILLFHHPKRKRSGNFRSMWIVLRVVGWDCWFLTESEITNVSI